MEAFTIKSRIKSLLRSPSIKLRRSRSGRIKDSLSSKVTLEKVLGITTAGNSGLTCDPCSGTVAYPAGCAVVLLNPATNTQQHLINSSRKSISTLSFSSDGRFLVTGESGRLAAVCVWDVSEGSLVSQLQEHKYGVSCVAFSPNGKYIVSVGSQHDMSVNLWAWKKSALMAVNKVSSKVTAVSFSEDGSYFVTAGNRHVRFWYLEPPHADQRACPVPLMGRSGLLGELQNNFFCDVACGRGLRSHSTFCVTASGLLCEFNSRRVLDRWVHLQTGSARSLAVTEDLIFCGCASGTVRVFGASDLRFIGSLPRPHHLGIQVSAATQTRHLFSRTPDARYPDSVAVTFDPVNRWLSCVYNDHSLYVWDTRDLRKVGKVLSALYHSSCVWDLQMFPSKSDGSSDPFVSCSSDSTVRLWSSDGVHGGNVLSNDLHHIFYMEHSTAALLDVEGTAISGSEKAEGSSADSRSGIRTICISPDGTHLASGDRKGTLRIHDLTCMKELVKAEVHDSEILCLEYSKPPSGVNLLATASRDRLIHVLDTEEDYGLLQTLDEHSSSITSVRFAAAGDGTLRIISCGADKSIYIHTAHRTVRGAEFKRTHHVVRKATPNDMDVDPTCKYAAVGSQDRSIRVINISSGKQKRSFSGSQTEDGSLLKVQIDPSGLFVASSCSDKNINLIDFQTGESLATVFGHSENITALRFSSDCRRLLSSSADSCIFVWQLAPELTISMRERLSAIRRRDRASSVRNNPFRRSSVTGFTLHRSTSIMTCSSESEREEEEDDDEDMKTAEETGASDETHWNPVKEASVDSSASAVACRPRRRWSCRVGSLELMVKSMLELRQLDSLSEAPGQSRSCADRCSTSSLQDWTLRRPRWLVPVGAPEPEGVVLYPDHCPSTSSLPGPSYQIQALSETAEHEERAEEAQSPVSGASMGYGSGGSSPDHRHHDVEALGSDEESCDGSTRPICDSESVPHQDVWRRSSETLTDGNDAGSQMRAEGLHSQKSSSRSSAAVKPTVSGVRPLMEDAGEPYRPAQRSHPYLSRVSRTSAGLQKSASAHSLSADRRSLSPSRLRRAARPVLPKLSLEKVAPHQPSSPQPWDSPTQSRVLRSYMSPTTSSMAKTSRSASIGDSLHVGSSSCESLVLPAPSLLTNTVRPRVCQRLSRSASSQNLLSDPSASSSSSSSSSSTDPQQTLSHTPRAEVKAFSVASDAPDDQGLPRRRSSSVMLLPLCFSPFFSLSSSRLCVSDASVGLELCRRAAADLCSSVRTATRLYRTLISHDAERSAEQQQMHQLMSDALLLVRSELDSVSGSSGALRMEEGKETLALLEQYSQLLLRSVERRLHQDE
ncbi:mitogen-activated protein kinase-binding protein 1-like isoform X1 [Sinocyclocheilus rhinocerous]|uniref:mitogen-activated protein kinase-binding protein 1-like isoform X1 n=1 Tax=Sinocyclocheilus rhinocerous TaxID=307959 RepID=UPI0007BA1FAD|nr:PREDICTED: mitogen-activated protein kinase-binding protein 1-like isoform X1 [Sinocyclocheilus rhinocerous]